MPSFSFMSAGVSSCVCVVGYVMSVSVPPRLSANIIMSTSLRIFCTVSNLSTTKEIMPPNPLVCRIVTS